MSFEVRYRDLLARIGRIETKSGEIETPALLPVVNSAVQSIPPAALRKEFGCKALITNAYILKRHGRLNSSAEGIHEFLDFDGVIMTDSGAYQILVYGKVELEPSEIVRYQEQISTDIATILDIPTEWKSTKLKARKSVETTVQRAQELASIKSRNDILWVAPIQGGSHLDLVAHCAREVGKLPFQIHALGSPTPVMEQYLFDKLVDMILTAKMNMPAQRPLHLFGAGHPFMFALTVALGCDTFDSAAYAIYARQNRYMTEYGTAHLTKLRYLPCSCPICTESTPRDLLSMPQEEKQAALAKHNLHVSFAELRRIKQAVVDGRLWEYLEARSHAHPALLQALKRLDKYKDYIECCSPISKRRGLLYFGHLGLMRPEIMHYRKRLEKRYAPPENSQVLILIPQPSKRPFHRATEITRLTKAILEKFPTGHSKVHICVYAAPFGVVPLELDEVYPLSQHEVAMPLDSETMRYVAERVGDYVATSSYRDVILIDDPDVWRDAVASACRSVRRKDLSVTILGLGEAAGDSILDNVVEALQKLLT